MAWSQIKQEYVRASLEVSYLRDAYLAAIERTSHALEKDGTGYLHGLVFLADAAMEKSRKKRKRSQPARKLQGSPSYTFCTNKIRIFRRFLAAEDKRLREMRDLPFIGDRSVILTSSSKMKITETEETEMKFRARQLRTALGKLDDRFTKFSEDFEEASESFPVSPREYKDKRAKFEDMLLGLDSPEMRQTFTRKMFPGIRHYVS